MVHWKKWVWFLGKSDYGPSEKVGMVPWKSDYGPSEKVGMVPRKK